MQYQIVWSDRWGGTGEKIAESAATADAWIEEFHDKGADAIVVYRDGVRINIAALPTLMRQETRSGTE